MFYVLSCPTCLVPYVLSCPTYPSASRASCPTCLVPYVPCVLRALVTHVPRALRASRALHALMPLVPYVLWCPTCSRASYHTCTRALRTSCPMCSRASCLTCFRVSLVLRTLVPNVSYMFLYLTCLLPCIFLGCSWLGLYGTCAPEFWIVLSHYRVYSILQEIFNTESDLMCFNSERS